MLKDAKEYIMTETLLLQLEEKIMALVAELEEARCEIDRLTQDNTLLKLEKDNHSKKIADILSLLDVVHEADVVPASYSSSAGSVKPMLVQG